MPKVLFVDDEKLNLDIFSSLMESENEDWQTRSVKDGREAKRVLNEWVCDILVTDLLMPNSDGIELLEHAREEYPDITRIVLSGCSEDSMVEKADKLSHARLEKPCRLEDIRHTLRQCHRLNSETEG